MKKLMYVITLFVISSVLLSCKDDVISPMDEVQPIEAIPGGENSTEGGTDPIEAGGVKPG